MHPPVTDPVTPSSQIVLQLVLKQSGTVTISPSANVYNQSELFCSNHTVSASMMIACDLMLDA